MKTEGGVRMPESRARTVRELMAKPESRAQSARKLRAKPESREKPEPRAGEGFGEGAIQFKKHKIRRDYVKKRRIMIVSRHNHHYALIYLFYRELNWDCKVNQASLLCVLVTIRFLALENI